MRVLRPAQADAGKRLDQFLAGRVKGVSRSRLQRLIDIDAVSVNGAAVRKSLLLKPGDKVAFDPDGLKADERAPVQAEDIPLDVLFEDKHIIAVNKPAGLVVHPGSGNRTGTLVNALMAHAEELADGFEQDRPGIVHRLDKQTSGVLLAAKTNAAHAGLAKQFQERSVEKEYLGVCVGRRPLDHGLVEQPLGRSRRDPTRVCVRHDGRPASTEYWLLAHRCSISVVRFRPHTGRTHQIRVHAAHLGMPVLADDLYGGGKEALMRLQPLDRPFAYKVFQCFKRHALHARRISFVHPQSGKRMKLAAPLPADMQNAIALFHSKVVI